MSVPKEELKEKPKPLWWTFSVQENQKWIEQFKKKEFQKLEPLYDDDFDTDSDDDCDKEVESITNGKLKS